MKEKDGIIANSPKSCFKEIFSLRLAGEDETVQLQEMADKRNETSHTYREYVAMDIYKELEKYSLLMEKILCGIRSNYPDATP